MAVNWEQALGSIGMMLSAMENPQQALLMGQGMANRNQMVAARKRREEEQAAQAQQQQAQHTLALSKHQLALDKHTQTQQQAGQYAALAAQYGFGAQRGVGQPPMPTGMGQPPMPGAAATYGAAPAASGFDVSAIGPGGPVPQAPAQRSARQAFIDSLSPHKREQLRVGIALGNQALIAAAFKPPERRYGAQEGLQYDLDSGEPLIPTPHAMSLQETKEARNQIAKMYGGSRNDLTGEFSVAGPTAAKVNRAEQVNAVYIKAGASRTDAMAATLYEMNFSGATVEDVSEHIRKIIDARMARKAAGEDLAAADAAAAAAAEKESSWQSKLFNLFNPVKDTPE